MSKCRAVLQQVEKASLLVDNKDEWVDIGRGIVIYICFLKELQETDLPKIGKRKAIPSYSPL